MKKVLIAAAAAAMFSTSAIAATITVEFTPGEGEKQVWKFDQEAGKATGPSGKEYDYTFDEAAQKLCANVEDGELCATFEGGDGKIEVGATATYSATNGSTGSATITAVE